MPYYPDGALAEKQQYINGMPDGLRETYYRNGVLKESQYFVLGFPAGDRKIWYPDGKLSSVDSYIYAPDELTYEVTANSAEKGDTIGVEFLVPEYKHGIWTFYHPNGTVERIGKYNKGVPYGAWYYYKASGVLLKKLKLEDLKLR